MKRNSLINIANFRYTDWSQKKNKTKTFNNFIYITRLFADQSGSILDSRDLEIQKTLMLMTVLFKI